MDQVQNNAQIHNNAQVQNQNNAPAQQAPPLPPPPVQNAPQVLPVVPPAGQVPIVQAQVHQNPNGNIDLKLQQTKLADSQN